MVWRAIGDMVGRDGSGVQEMHASDIARKKTDLYRMVRSGKGLC